MTHLLTFDNIFLTRGVIYLKGLGLSLKGGEVCHLQGRNGSGKSTLMLAIAGLYPIDQGTVEKQDFHYIAHENALDDDLTVRENLTFWRDFLGGSIPEMAQFQRHMDTPVKHLSAGQQRMVGLSRLLMREKPLWLLDEPFQSLDQSHSQWLENMIKHHKAQGGAALIIHHGPLDSDKALKL